MILTYFTERGNDELYPVIAGHYACPPSNSYGPHVREHYILHFVLSGKGTLCNSTGTHQVSKGEMFLIRRGEVTTYTADKEDPWEYTWLGFNGNRAKLFDSIPDVMKIPSDIDKKLCEYAKRERRSPDIFSSILYELVYQLFSPAKDDSIDERILNVSNYIKYNYSDDITVSGLATTFGIERSYLYRIFKEKYGVGPKKYLTRVRLDKAKWLLARGYSVAECAYMVGYSDAFSFSKAYKSFFGKAPSHSETDETQA